jgi:transcriptional regulator with XRE-family HTH domain
MIDLKDFENRLQSERKRLGFTQTAFGGQVGVSRATQNLYEAGRGLPDLEYLERAAKVGGDVPFLLGMQGWQQMQPNTFNWDLAQDLMNAIFQVAEELDIAIASEKLVPLLRVFYQLATDETAPVNSDRKHIAAVLKAAA